jgi:hypothetical protein
MLVEDAVAQQIAAMLRGTSRERGSDIEVSSYGLFGSARITWGERSEKIVIEVLAAGTQNSYNKPSVNIKLVARSASSSTGSGTWFIKGRQNKCAYWYPDSKGLLSIAQVGDIIQEVYDLAGRLPDYLKVKSPGVVAMVAAQLAASLNSTTQCDVSDRILINYKKADVSTRIVVTNGVDNDQVSIFANMYPSGNKVSFLFDTKDGLLSDESILSVHDTFRLYGIKMQVEDIKSRFDADYESRMRQIAEAL